MATELLIKNRPVAKVNPIIKKLRLDNFKKGYSFLIHGDDLPDDQTYMEHPDGRITVEQLTDSNHSFVFIRELGKQESNRLRKQYGLETV